MAYNCYGDLYKSEVASRLRDRGYDVKNVHALNVILEEMGIQVHSGNNWLVTEAGVKYTIYKGPVFDADAWHPEIVDVVSDYLDNR
ncbi:hypothetical protein [Butyrivibrio proteoclasticus]|uniref:hypothetical protein n=1 Tax=Butyrivibrio proteoclasticus TaxID=43305 RepID=UPI000479ABDB|nr:hypothetical protein [Butyrivibrio proteoclasticus]